MTGSTGPRRWDAASYDRGFTFVWKHGADLIDALDPQPGMRVLDIGCGTGHLTGAIAGRGAVVVGLDRSPDMIGQAAQNVPGIPFVIADARALPFGTAFDAVFSNATLHWITEPELVIEEIRRVLKPGGRFVAELGAAGNVAKLIATLCRAMAEAGYEPPTGSPWYYPTLAGYTNLLERHGLEPIFATVFDRPTVLEGGEGGLCNWFAMFAGWYLDPLPPPARAAVIARTEAILRPDLYRDGRWTADYRRLRVVAVRSSS